MLLLQLKVVLQRNMQLEMEVSSDLHNSDVTGDDVMHLAPKNLLT